MFGLLIFVVGLIQFSAQKLQGKLILEGPLYAENGSNLSIRCIWKECSLAQGCGKDDWILNYETPLHGIIYFCGGECKVPWNKSKFRYKLMSVFSGGGY